MHIARDSTWAVCVLQLIQDLSQKKHSPCLTPALTCVVKTDSSHDKTQKVFSLRGSGWVTSWKASAQPCIICWALKSSVAPSSKIAWDCQSQALLSLQRLRLFPGSLRGKGMILSSANKASLWFILADRYSLSWDFLSWQPYALLHERHHNK